MVRKVTINYDRLCEELKKKGKSKSQLSLELGRCETFISEMNKKREQPETIEKLICILLELEPGSLIEPEKRATGADAKALENIYKKLCKIEELVLFQSEIIEKILSKSNANTVQLEKIKDRLKDVTKSDYEKACDFLRSLLSEGRVISEEILLKADANGIKRADLMKAKRELQVDTATTGYGKNQKTWWFIPS